MNHTLRWILSYFEVLKKIPKITKNNDFEWPKISYFGIFLNYSLHSLAYQSITKIKPRVD